MTNYLRVALPHLCSVCGAIGTAVHSESFHPGDAALHYGRSFRCQACGATTEADGDRVPEDVRPAFYREHGKFGLQLVAEQGRVSEIARIFRKVLGLAISDALELARGSADVA